MYKLEKKKAESFWENLYLKLKVKEEFQKINLSEASFILMPKILLSFSTAFL
jgi:hypothetical protein